ncbi:MAG: ABC transporter ATP-binding protein, partial [Anaerolineales bacterium]|nr:ABC transporter ATP-binding protein [Anaerolineales bacterium]
PAGSQQRWPGEEIEMELTLAIRVEDAVKAFGAKTQSPVTRLSGPEMARPRGAVALDRLSLDVRPGEIFGLVGPNGGGKTTLIRLVAAQLAPDAGRVMVFGHDTARDPCAVRAALGRFGPVAPGAGFFQKLSPVENLLYGARQFAARPAETRRQMFAILRRLGLPQAALYRPMEGLSRGTQQKVAIARAFLAEPRLLLLDEPTTGLDPRSRREVQALIRELRDEHGTTVLLTTHDMLEAEQLCDRVAIVDGGRLVALDAPAALKQRLALTAGRPVTLEDVFLALTRQPTLAEETDE